MTLSDKACKNAKAKEKAYKLSDGLGLYLHIYPNGSKCWQQKYRYMGKENTFSHGTYPLISLAEAREKALEIKKQLKSGINPNETKKTLKRNALRDSQNTFEAVAREWHEVNKEKWSDKHAQRTIKQLENHVFPRIGSRPIKDVTAQDLLYDVLKDMEKAGTLDTVSRVKQLCGQVLRYGHITGKECHDITINLKDALKTKKTKHFAALETKDIPELLGSIERNDARLHNRTRRAIHLSLLLFQRPGEIRQARWQDIDFETKEWTIPAELMKARRSHIVPLSEQAIRVLEEQQRETGHLNTPYVFPSQTHPRKPMSDGTVNTALKKLGFEGRMTAHGFRALARTTIREKLDYPPDVIEAQLAHKPSGPLGEAYDRAKFLDQRHTMIQDWADYIDNTQTGKIIQAQFRKNVA